MKCLSHVPTGAASFRESLQRFAADTASSKSSPLPTLWVGVRPLLRGVDSFNALINGALFGTTLSQFLSLDNTRNPAQECPIGLKTKCINILWDTAFRQANHIFKQTRGWGDTAKKGGTVVRPTPPSRPLGQLLWRTKRIFFPGSVPPIRKGGVGSRNPYEIFVPTTLQHISHAVSGHS